MDANSNSKIQKKTFIERWLEELNVEQIGWDSKFYKLDPRKTTITSLLLSFFPMAITGTNGYHIWAGYFRELTGVMVSKVALWKRMGKALSDCLQAILEKTIKRKVHAQSLCGKNSRALFSPFGETYLQDSTIIPLPEVLKPYYKGSVSMGKQKSSIRVQAIYGLSSGTFKEFTLGSFTDNDQGASGNILKLLKRGDLMIRDMGYFVLNVFKKVALAGAFFLSHYRYDTNIYDAQTGNQIPLEEVLKGSQVDRKVLLGAKEKLPCRLIAVKLPDHVAAEKRRKAKKDRDKRLNHTKEYMDSLDWAIFITNIESEVWGPKEVLKAYRVRWHIEIIFKGWKSHLNMVGLVPEAPKANRNGEKYLWRYKCRVDSAILMMLIFITIFQVSIYTSLGFKIWQDHGKLVSNLKLYAYIAHQKEKILQCIDLEDLELDIAYYATYDKRRKRLNHLERLMQIFDYQHEYTLG